MKKEKIILCCVYLIFGILMMNISPYNYPELHLNNIGTLFLLILMIIDVFKNVLSKAGFWGLFIFSVLHSIGSTWLYSFVPYNDSFRSFHLIQTPILNLLETTTTVLFIFLLVSYSRLRQKISSCIGINSTKNKPCWSHF